MNKAVILAAGRGTRMRAADAPVRLTTEQARAAEEGIKGMIPLNGRPFLDYVLSALADAGIREACLVVRPGPNSIREYYEELSTGRITIQFAIQEEQLGTANALLAARPFVAGQPFLALNSDNYYPVEVFAALRALGEPGLVAFERESLIEKGNIPRQRVADFAILRIGADGYLERIVEKPVELRDSPIQPSGGEMLVSMNCWRFDDSIFRACEQVPRSVRGEFELPVAVQFGIDTLGMRFKAAPFHKGVLDLSRRSDIPGVEERLEGIRVNL